MKTHRKQTLPEILNRGSLMTYQDNERERCFGYLFEFPGHGIFEPTFGKLDVSPEEAKTHNQLLSQAEIDGLDRNCAVGLGGLFYTKKAQNRIIVVTWLGQEVSQEVQVRDRMLTFTRKDMSFRGRLRQDEDCFGFKRVH
jgi:hypothetical protein